MGISCAYARVEEGRQNVGKNLKGLGEPQISQVKISFVFIKIQISQELTSIIEEIQRVDREVSTSITK